jgi:hypothetical protein
MPNSQKQSLLKDLDLHEVSLVTAGANQHARIMLFKSACPMGKGKDCPTKSGEACGVAGCKDEDTTDMKKSAEGVQFNIGFPEDGTGAQVQSVMFDVSKWDVEKASKWLKDHKMKVSKAQTTDTDLIFKQKDSTLFKRSRMVTPGEQIAKCLGPFTFQQAVDAVNTAVRGKYQTAYKSDAPASVEDNSYVWIRDVYEDHVIFEQGGKVYDEGFSLQKSNDGSLLASLNGDKTAVVAVYVPANYLPAVSTPDAGSNTVGKGETSMTHQPDCTGGELCKCADPKAKKKDVEGLAKADETQDTPVEEAAVTKAEPTMADVLAAITNLTSTVEKVATNNDDLKKVVDGLVEKSQTLDGKLASTVLAPPQPGDSPANGSHAVQKVDTDPRTGCFDTAFLRKRR